VTATDPLALFVFVTHGDAGLAAHLAAAQPDADALEALYGASVVHATSFTAADIDRDGRHALVGQVLMEARESVRVAKVAAQEQADLDAYLAYQERREAYEWEVIRLEGLGEEDAESA
jgi:hypothetical protein